MLQYCSSCQLLSLFMPLLILLDFLSRCHMPQPYNIFLACGIEWNGSESLNLLGHWHLLQMDLIESTFANMCIWLHMAYELYIYIWVSVWAKHGVPMDHWQQDATSKSPLNFWVTWPWRKMMPSDSGKETRSGRHLRHGMETTLPISVCVILRLLIVIHYPIIDSLQSPPLTMAISFSQWIQLIIGYIMNPA